MLSKFKTIWVVWGHLNNAYALGALIVGLLGWAFTFFSSALEGWSVTSVWLTSLIAGALCAIIWAAVGHSLRNRNSSSSVTPLSSEKRTASESRMVADYQAALKLPIIDEAISVLNHNAVFEQPIDDAGKFIVSIVPELKAGRRDELVARLNELRQRFVANNQRIGTLYVQIESIHEDIATLLVQPYSDALMEGIYELSEALTKLDNPAASNLEYWIKPPLDKFKAGVSGVGAWRGTTLFALFDLRKKLIS
jgi:hypothetical protein